GRGGRHAQPHRGGRERLPAGRAGGARGDRGRQRAHRRVRLVQRCRHARGRARRARGRRTRGGRPPGGRRSTRGGARRLRLLRGRGRRGRADLPAALPVRRARGAGGAGVVPSAPLAVAFLLLRASMSQMDVPARQAYVMSLVPPEERMAASSVTNVPRSLAAAIPPLFTGILLDRSSFGWPLVLGGALK